MTEDICVNKTKLEEQIELASEKELLAAVERYKKMNCYTCAGGPENKGVCGYYLTAEMLEKYNCELK